MSVFIKNTNQMEECSLQIRGEVQQIYKVLMKEQNDKMPFQGIEIVKTLSRLPFFRRFFDMNSEFFVNMCIAQDAIQCEAGTDVYKLELNEGLERYIYVVLQGLVKLSGEESTDRILGVLGTFGQTEILFGLDSRRQTAITLQDCKLMRIKQSMLLKVFHKMEDLKKCLYFLNVNEYFRTLNELEKMELTLLLVRKSYEKGDIIKVAGEGLEEMFFFIYGKVQVLSTFESQGRQKQFIIDYLEEMSSFGQYECTTKLGTSVKLRGTIAGAYYEFKLKQIENEQHKILRIVKGKAMPYPTSEQLQFLERAKRTLKKQQNRVMKGLRIRK